MKLLIIALAATVLAAPATAGITYMTGSTNPWNLDVGDGNEDAAMNLAFGAGNWTKVNGYTTSVFSAANSFIYIDAGNGTSSEFDPFVDTATVATMEAWVNAGGRLMINGARWSSPTLSLPFGSTLVGSLYSTPGTLTAAGIAAGLGANGAGNSWTGDAFSHDVVTGGTCLVTGDAGCVFAIQAQGAGSFALGGQTSPYFHSAGGLQLRANQLQLVAGGTPVIPEPATWAMMIAGFGLVGAAMRRRNTAVA